MEMLAGVLMTIPEAALYFLFFTDDINNKQYYKILYIITEMIDMTLC